MGPKQVPILAVALGLEDANQTFGAARALGWLGPQAKSAGPTDPRLRSTTPRIRDCLALSPCGV